MRQIVIAVVALVACTAAPDATASPTVGVLEPVAIPTVSTIATCGTALTPLATVKASAVLLPHRIDDLVVFGLDGSFLASGVPGARWWETGTSGAITREFDWAMQGRLLQSPDGARIVYRATDPASGEPALFVRELTTAPRLLAVGVWSPQSWPDADHVFVRADDDPTPLFRLDVRSGALATVFEPPELPEPEREVDDEYLTVSGDAKFAMVQRTDLDGYFFETHLYNVGAGAFVDTTLPKTNEVWLSPRGDLAAWVQGKELIAMHLCDQKPVVLAGLGSFAGPFVGGIRWSGDGRFLSITSGVTDALRGPRAVLVADLERGRAALLVDPWGFISRWSPDGAYVVLSRGAEDRLARLTITTP
jgi:hypothetical protein